MQEYKQNDKLAFMTFVSLIAVMIGFVAAFFGFYLMSRAVMAQGGEMSNEEMALVNLVIITGLFIMLEGVFYCIAGFYGALNNGIDECALKIRKYGLILSVLGVINAILLAISVKGVFNYFNVAMMIAPLVFGLMYLLGAILNISKIKQRGGIVDNV